MLISFIACGETNEPVITEAPESSSSSNTAGEETSSATETTATEATETETETTSAPLIFPGFANIGFASIRDMIEILKKGEIDLKANDYAWFADESWLEIDFDRFYELENVPKDYYELGVEWTGKNDYQIIYYNLDLGVEAEKTPNIVFGNSSSKEELEIFMKEYSIKTEERIRDSFSIEISVESEETEYGVLYTYRVGDTGTYFKRMDVTDENGDLLWIYYVKYYSHNGDLFCFLINFSGDFYYSVHTNYLDISLEDLLSLTPVKVEVDG